MSELFKGHTLVLKNGSKVKGEDHLKNKVTVIYFSAGWCPPCRNFTPKLKVNYKKLIKTINFRNFMKKLNIVTKILKSYLYLGIVQPTIYSNITTIIMAIGPI